MGIIFLAGVVYFSGDDKAVVDVGLSEEQIKHLETTNFLELTDGEQALYRDFLAEDAYYFRLYVEHEYSGAFTAPYLLYEVLLKEDIINYIEEQAGVDFGIDPEIALAVTKESSNVIHEIQVGTGNDENNKKLANAIITAIENEIDPFLKNKKFYILSEEALSRAEYLEDLDPELVNENETGLNLVVVAIMVAAGLASGFVAGLMIALIMMFMNNETSELYEFRRQSNDVILDFSKFKKISGRERTEMITHAISYPAQSRKVILSQSDTDSKLLSHINKEYQFEVVNNVSEMPRDHQYDEVIIIAKRMFTTKNWYENQRLQLQNYASRIKIIIE